MEWNERQWVCYRFVVVVVDRSGYVCVTMKLYLNQSWLKRLHGRHTVTFDQ
jgi:hypothetical protein